MLASDRIQGNFCFLAAVAAAMALTTGSYVVGQVIVPASELVAQPGDLAAQDSGVSELSFEPHGISPDTQTLLKDARSAMGVRNYEMAAQLITQAHADPASDQLAYTPAMAQQELAMWMQRDGLAGQTGDAQPESATEVAMTDRSAALTTSTQPLSEIEIETVLRTFLQARQALAHGDTVTAQLLVESVADRPIDFEQTGDSPAFVQAMIERQNELTAMASLHDPAYNQAAAGFLLSQAEALVHYNDFDNATLLIDQAKSFPVEFDSQSNTPERIEKMMSDARARMETPLQASQNAAPAVDHKAEAAKLISMAQLAIAKEEWYDASSLIERAKALNVPETDFSANEVRPWQLELQVRNALNRSGASTNLSDESFDGPVDNSVAQASATDSGDAVIQAMYDPETDSTFNTTVAGYDPAVVPASAVEPVKEFNAVPSRGLELFQSGMDALGRADKAKAKEYFESAWQFEGQLDATTRQEVQDQLTLLGVSTSAGSVDPNQESLDLEEVRMQRQNDYRRLQSEVFKQREAAERALEENPREALEIMSTLRNRIAQSALDRDSQRPLLVSIDRNISEMQDYIENNLPEIENREMNAANLKTVEDRAERRVETEKQMQQLVEEYNELMRQKRFAEAMVVVRQAVDLDPDSEIATVLKEKATNRIRSERMDQLREAKESGNYSLLESIESDMVQGDYENPYSFGDPDNFSERSRNRIARAEQRNYSSDAERTIWNQLRNEKVQGEYRGTLNEAVEQLSNQTGINIVFDDLALQAEGIDKDTQIDVPIISPITMQSALDLILNSAGLVYVVESEVIKVTSRDSQQSNLVTKIYYIGDLVMPKSTSTTPFHMNFMQQNAPNQLGGSFNVAQQQGNPVMGQQLGGANGLGGLNYGGSSGPQSGTPSFSSMGGRQLGGITQSSFIPLINLIQNTIQNESWQDTGSGLGTIQPFVANLSLIVSQTQEIQDEIQDLLKKLRELNDVQIVVEVRFMILSDDFFERIGVDFDFNLNDNAPEGLAAIDNVDKSAVVGFNAGSITGDQDVQFAQDSFSQAIPAFGGSPAASAANFGFAILSDIEVFFLLQAAKGNSRSNVMQAPTVTMFNGQSASISDGQSRPFVTGVIPVVGDFAVGQQPIITLIPDGTNLSVQATVSEDRRFVRLNLSPFFSEITDVETFTFDGQSSTERSTDSVLDDLLDLVDGGLNADDSDDELITENSGVTVQQPIVAFTSVNTVVSVPDGGTVLLGGIKRMSESREEAGVPMLSNIPYINRLFKNVGIGQETSNLMMMVTPRILIQEELEEDQVGLINN